MTPSPMTGALWLAAAPLLWALRVGVIVVALGVWFWTQARLAKRPAPEVADGGVIGDGLHQLTAVWHRRLRENPRRASSVRRGSAAKHRLR